MQRSRSVWRAVLWSSLAVPLGCGPADPGSQQEPSITTVPPASAPKPVRAQAPSLVAADAKPSPPLAISAPPPPPREFQGRNLAEVPGEQLIAIATQLAGEGRDDDAIVLQHWGVQATGQGQYNLACYYAKSGQADAAFYWLQDAALTEGVDGEWALQDPDLDVLRRDSRWEPIAAYLRSCNQYWAASGLRRTTLVLPEGYQPGTPIGVVAGLHGLGADPDGFVNDGFQQWANELGMAFVGISGTEPSGPHSFSWSERIDADHERVQEALREVSDRLTPEPGQVVLFGFSQGAQMSFEVALSHPESYRGALVMSPGTLKDVTFASLEPTPENHSQGFVLTCGADEAPGNVANTRRDADYATRAGSRVELKLYDGVAEHRFPPDFADNLVSWIRWIADRREPLSPTTRTP